MCVRIKFFSYLSTKYCSPSTMESCSFGFDVQTIVMIHQKKLGETHTHRYILKRGLLL